jgi:hypothetical protein
MCRSSPQKRAFSAELAHEYLQFPWANVSRLWKARPYLTTYRGLERPWAPLERFVGGMRVQPVMFGTNYLAHGRVGGKA